MVSLEPVWLETSGSQRDTGDELFIFERYTVAHRGSYRDRFFEMNMPP